MRFGRILRIIGATVAIVLVVAAAALVVALRFVDFNDYKPLIADEVRKATGRNLVIAGDLGVKLSLFPALTAERLRLANAAWGARPDMATVDRLEVQLGLVSLLFGSIEVRRVTLSGADILLEVDAYGRANFDFAGEAEPATGPQPPTASGGSGIAVPFVDEIVVRNAVVTYRRPDGGPGRTLAIEALTIEGAGPAAPIAVHYRGRYGGAPLAFAGTLGSLEGLLAPARPWPLALTVEAGGATGTVDGTIAEPLAARGFDLAVAIEGGALADLSPLAGTDLPPLGPYRLAGRLSGDAGTAFEFSELQAAIAGSDLSGRLQVGLAGQRPRIDGSLSARRIDLAALAGGGAKAAARGEDPVRPRGRATADGPLRPLTRFDAALRLQALSLAVDGARLENVDIRLALADGRLVVEPATASLAGGSVAASVRLDARETAPVLAAKLTARRLDLARLANDPARANMLSVDAEVEVALGPARGIALRQSRLTVTDPDGTVTRDLAIETLKLRDAAARPGQIELFGEGRYNGTPLRVAGHAGRLADLAAAAAPWPLDLEISGGGALASLRGTISRPLQGAGIDLAVAVAGDRLSDLSALAGTQMPALGAYRLSTRLSGDVADSLRLRALEVVLAGHVVEGRAEIAVAGESDARRGGLAAAPLALSFDGRYDGIAVVLEARTGPLAELSAPPRPWPLEVELRGLGARAAMRGTIARPLDGAGLDLGIDVAGADLAALSRVVGRQLPVLGTFAVAGRITADELQRLSLSGLRVTVGGSDVAGEATLDLSGVRPRLAAALVSRRIDATALPPGVDETAPRDSPSAEAVRLLPADPLPLDVLRSVDLQLEFYAETVITSTVLTSGARLEKTTASLVLDGGRLVIDPVVGRIGDGSFTASFGLDARTAEPAFVAKAALDQFDLGQVLKEMEVSDGVSARANLDIDVAGRGASIRDIAAGLNGTTVFVMGEGWFRSADLNTLLGGPRQILSDVIRRSRSDKITVSCGFLLFDIESGVATLRSALLDTNVSLFVGAGQIDLRDESLNLVTQPVAKRTMLSFGVPVHVTGTLANPSYRLDNRGVARRIVGVIGVFAFPPAAVIGLGELGAGDDNSCLQIAETGTLDDAPQPTDQRVVPRPRDVIKGVGEGITKGLKGLFGE